MAKVAFRSELFTNIAQSLARHKLLITIQLLLLIFIPGLMLSREGIIDPYNLISLAAAEKAQALGIISKVGFGEFSYDPYQQGCLGYESILIVLLSVLGKPSLAVAVMPIGSILVPLLFFCLTRKIFGSNILAAFFAIYMAFDPSISSSHYNIFVYSWVEILMFSFIIITLNIYDNGKNIRLIILLLILFTAAFSMYWTTPFIMMVFLVIMNGLVLFKQKVEKKVDYKKFLSFNISIAMLVIYLGFSQVLYSEFIHVLVKESSGGSLDAIYDLMSWLSSNNSVVVDPYSANLELPIYNIILMLRYIVIFTPIFIYITYISIKTLITRRFEKPDRKSFVLWPSLSGATVQSIAYAMRGHLSLRYSSILLLPATIISLEKLGLKRMKIVVCIIIILLAVGGFFYLYSEGFPTLNKTSNIGVSAHFLIEKSNTESYALTDMNTFGIYLIEGVEYNNTFSIILYNSNYYDKLLGNSNFSDTDTGKYIKYIIINNKMANDPTASSTWRSYEPIADHYDQINTNTELSKIYDDININILIIT